MQYRQRVIGGKLQFVAEGYETQYRQRVIGGKLQSVPPKDDREMSPFDENNNIAPFQPETPFDEQDEQMPTMSKSAERRQVEDFHDMYNEDDYEASSIDGWNRLVYEIDESDDRDDDTVSTISRNGNECGEWHPWKIPGWLRRMATISRNGTVKKSAKHDDDSDSDTEGESCTTATDSSASYSSFGSIQKSTSVPRHVLDILFDEIADACGNLEPTNDTGVAIAKSYRIVKKRQSEKVGLTFATNHDDGAVYICEIKKGSKFLRTGLQVGSRVLSINGNPVPLDSRKLLRMLNEAKRELVLVAETPETKVKSYLEEVRRDNDSTVISNGQ